MRHFERGSEWRRWDLHIHTPGTIKNDQYCGSTIEEKWANFYASISSYIGDGSDPLKAIKVIGITDYLSIDNYLKVITDNKIPESISLILPNVELRMVPLAKNSPVNIHCIFDHDTFRRQVLNALRGRKGLADLPVQRSVRQEKERAYNRLASVVRASLDMEKLAQIMGETSC